MRSGLSSSIASTLIAYAASPTLCTSRSWGGHCASVRPTIESFRPIKHNISARLPSKTTIRLTEDGTLTIKPAPSTIETVFETELSADEDEEEASEEEKEALGEFEEFCGVFSDGAGFPAGEFDLDEGEVGEV